MKINLNENKTILDVLCGEDITGITIYKHKTIIKFYSLSKAAKVRSKCRLIFSALEDMEYDMHIRHFINVRGNRTEVRLLYAEDYRHDSLRKAIIRMDSVVYGFEEIVILGTVMNKEERSEQRIEITISCKTMECELIE